MNEYMIYLRLILTYIFPHKLLDHTPCVVGRDLGECVVHTAVASNAAGMVELEQV